MLASARTTSPLTLYAKKNKIMKYILTYILLITFSFVGNSQESNNFSFLAGLEVTAENIRSPKLSEKPIFWNYGLITELHIKNNWVIHLNISHSIRKYETRQGGLIFESDLFNGTSSYYLSTVEEKLVEIENYAKYKFLNKKISPFIGIGYAIQFPYSVSGERKIVYGDGTIGNLKDPEEFDIKTNYGLYTNLGLNYAIIDRLVLVFDLGHKWYFNSNLIVYGFPKLEESPNRHNSFVLSLGVLYKLK
jgi:hypothetical protein